MTNPERHLYHEFYLVIEGRGTTETWIEGADSKQIVEWQPGSLFYLPPNVNHRLVNATNERVLIIATTNAAADHQHLPRPWTSSSTTTTSSPSTTARTPTSTSYDEQLYAIAGQPSAPRRGPTTTPTSSTASCPLDNQRAPGYRRIQPGWRGFEDDHGGFIAQYPPGRYSRAHYHGAGAVLVCLRGGGLHLQLARRARPDALEGRPRRRGQGARLRPGRPRRRRAGRWRLVPPALRRQPPSPSGSSITGAARCRGWATEPEPRDRQVEQPEHRGRCASIGYSSEDPYIRGAFE